MTAFFALAYFLPGLSHYVSFVAVPFFLYFAWSNTTYALGKGPSLILNSSGLLYRINGFSNVVVPWENVLRVAIETSSSQYRGRTISSTYLSIYLRDASGLVRQLPVVQRVWSWISVRMGSAPLFVPAARVDVPLESVVEAMHRYAVFSEMPSARLSGI